MAYNLTIVSNRPSRADEAILHIFPVTYWVHRLVKRPMKIDGGLWQRAMFRAFARSPSMVSVSDMRSEYLRVVGVVDEVLKFHSGGKIPAGNYFLEIA